MPTLDEILSSFTDENGTWNALDRLIGAVPDRTEQLRSWEHAAQAAESKGVSCGHAHFRLGVLHLVLDPEESKGIWHLERAYEQDQTYAAPPRQAHRMAAYRVLGLVKDFLSDLRRLRQKGDWRGDQLDPPYREMLMRTLLAIYDESTRHILDAQVFTYSPFFDLVVNHVLRRFAGENYYCAQDLLEHLATTHGQHLLQLHEYPLARSVIGLYGGVLEAILMDKVSPPGRPTLGALITDGHTKGLIVVGTRLCAVATMLLYFRNHVHPDRETARQEYFIDMNVARGLKIAIDLAINDLSAKLAKAGVASTV